MREGGRLVADGSESQGVWRTNILPVLMSREELMAGLRRLGNRLYSPASFARRSIAMIERFGPQLGPFRAGYKPHRPRTVDIEAIGVVRKLITSGPEEREMYKMICQAVTDKPETGPMVVMAPFSYAQVRCLYEAATSGIPRSPTGHRWWYRSPKRPHSRCEGRQWKGSRSLTPAAMRVVVPVGELDGLAAADLLEVGAL